MCMRYRKHARGSTRSENLACTYTRCLGTGRSLVWPSQNDGPHREGDEPKPMMYEREKSDLSIVAVRPTNNGEQSSAELVEPMERAKGNTTQTSTCRTQSRGSVSPGLDRVRKAAKGKRKERLTALLHHIDVRLLRVAYLALKRNAAPGVDGVTWQAYGENLEANIADLHRRVHRGNYRALPSRRRMIPKPNGGKRPLGIAALEDKIVQRAVAEVFNAIYEPEFLGFSYGFRPERSQHDALDALAVAVHRKAVNWIVDADIQSFLDRCSQCPPVYDVRSNRTGWSLKALILKPFRLPW